MRASALGGGVFRSGDGPARLPIACGRRPTIGPADLPAESRIGFVLEKGLFRGLGEQVIASSLNRNMPHNSMI